MQLFLSAPWGSGGMPEHWTPRPMTSAGTGEHPGWARAHVRVRAMPVGEVAVLAADRVYAPEEAVSIQRYSSQGTLLATVQVAPPGVAHEDWRVTDFLNDADGNIYLLETFRSGADLRNSLRKLDACGKSVWAQTGPFDAHSFALEQLRGTFDQLLMDARGSPHLALTRHRGLVARIDAASGALESYADWGAWTGEVFMDGAGRLYYVRYDAESRRRGWTRYDPDTRQEEVHWGDDSVYGLFDIPIGVDAQGRCYTAMGPRFTCLTREAQLLWQEHIDNGLVTGDAVYASQSRPAGPGAEVLIRRWDRDGAYAGETVLTVPSPPADESLTRWRLVSRDDAGRFHVSGGAAPEDAGLVYSPRAELEAITQPSRDSAATETRLQEARTWSVDLEGAVYLPVLGPSAFYLVKLIVNANRG